MLELFEKYLERICDAIPCPFFSRRPNCDCDACEDAQKAGWLAAMRLIHLKMNRNLKLSKNPDTYAVEGINIHDMIKKEIGRN